MDPAPRRQFGQHSISYEGTDVVLLTLCGDVSADEMTTALHADSENFRCNGYALLLVDGRGLGAISPEARRTCNRILNATWPYDGPYRGSIAIFGLNRAMQALLLLIVRAVELVRPHGRKVAFMSDGAAARTWLSEQRPQYLAAGPQQP